MNRREFGIWIGAMLVGAMWPAPKPPVAGSIMFVRRGDMDIARYERLSKTRTDARLRVFVDGEDVTESCTRANDVRGYAVLIKHHNGKPFVGPGGELSRETRTGDVRFVWQPKA